MRPRWRKDTPFTRLVLEVEEEACATCGRPLHVCDHRQHRIFTLQGPLELVCKLAHCCDRGCAGHAKTLSPYAETTLTLPWWLIGWDVFCWMGHRRFSRHWSVPQIRGELLDSYRIPLSADAIEDSLRRYQIMLAARQQDAAVLTAAYRQVTGLVLSIDGLQPEKGHETLYVVRELNTKRVWFAEALLSSSAAEVGRLLRQARDWATQLGLPVQLWLSDKQDAFVKGIAAEFSGVPHRYCANHFLRDLAKPMLEADSRAKVQMRSKVRGLRAIEREVLQQRQAAAAATAAVPLAAAAAAVPLAAATAAVPLAAAAAAVPLAAAAAAVPPAAATAAVPLAAAAAAVPLAAAAAAVPPAAEAAAVPLAAAAAAVPPAAEAAAVPPAAEAAAVPLATAAAAAEAAAVPLATAAAAVPPAAAAAAGVSLANTPARDVAVVTKPGEPGDVVLDYCCVVRGILNDDQGGPLQPPGLRMAEALQEVRASLQRNLDAQRGGCAHGQLQRLAGCIDRGLTAVQAEQAEVRQHLPEVARVARTLEPGSASASERQAQFTRLQEEFAGKDTPFYGHVVAVMASFAAGLFTGGDVLAGLQDNLELERWFRKPKGHERRIHGHKHAGVRLVQEGPTLMLALDAHVAHPEPFTAEDLQPYQKATAPACQEEALHRRKIMRKARSKKNELSCCKNWNAST